MAVAQLNPPLVQWLYIMYFCVLGDLSCIPVMGPVVS